MSEHRFGLDLEDWPEGMILLRKQRAGYSATAAQVLRPEDQKILEDLFKRTQELGYWSH